MLVKVKPNEFQILRELEVETYGDTLYPYISDADMEDYYQTVLSLEQIQKDLAEPESETIWSLITIRNLWFSSSLTGVSTNRASRDGQCR